MTVRVAEVSELPMSSCVPGIKLGYTSMCRSVFCSPQAILNVGLLFSAKIRLKNKHQDARVEAPRKKHINQNPCFWWQHAHLNWHDFEKHDPFKTFSYRCNKFWVDSDCSVYVLVVIPEGRGYKPAKDWLHINDSWWFMPHHQLLSWMYGQYDKPIVIVCSLEAWIYCIWPLILGTKLWSNGPFLCWLVLYCYANWFDGGGTPIHCWKQYQLTNTFIIQWGDRRQKDFGTCSAIYQTLPFRWYLAVIEELDRTIIDIYI